MRTVTLPDGKEVTISDAPLAWWTTDGATGYISPTLLLPDPNQPRKVIGGNDWADYKISIKLSGVREIIRVTPLSHAPWVTAPADNTCPFLIVSGHRRHLGALAAELTAVPIIVKIYPDEAAHRADADELNVGRKDLTPFEEGVEIARRRALGETWEVIAKKRAMSTLTCRGRYQLLNLAPAIQSLIDPTVRQGKRSDFPINIAQALGSITDVTPLNFLMMMDRFGLIKTDLDIDHTFGDKALSFALQQAVLARIQSDIMSASQAVEFITNGKTKRQKNGGRGGGSAFGRSPEKLRHSLLLGLRGPTKTASATLTRDMIRHACAGQPIQQIENLLEEAKKSLEELERLQGILKNIYEGKLSAQVTLPKQIMEPIPPPRTMQNMSPEEIAATAKRYGVVVKQQ